MYSPRHIVSAICKNGLRFHSLKTVIVKRTIVES